MPGRVRTGLKIGRSPRSSASSIDIDLSQAVTMKKARKGSKDRTSAKVAQKGAPAPPPAVTFDMVIESPPVVFYGPASTSTGALLSGQLKVNVNEVELRVDDFHMDFQAFVQTKKPVQSHCPDCAVKDNTLCSWNFLTEPVTLKKGTHAYPFSYLLPGHLPSTSHGALANVDYKLSAKATTHSAETFRFERAIDVKRAIMSGEEKSSLRVFPPTSLTANIVLQPVIHPIGEFPVQFRMEGLVKRGPETQTRWRMRKMNWRIDEKSKMISPPCTKHSHKVGGEKKGVLHEDVRTIGAEDLKGGWKTDFSGTGQVEIAFQAAINSETRPVCDVDSATGMVVSHTLIIEMVVAEEYCYNKTPKLVTPTGAARILRTSFNVTVTERSGLGISWDEEQPPVYDDVPASPPTYTQMEDFDTSSLDGEPDRLILS
ncbi:MAG: hypothetical protein M1833_006872 [Piccolia ochrophora]|nr:MAG: hypothetical protein M1833_006872 [Piccolia ochrophora]